VRLSTLGSSLFWSSEFYDLILTIEVNILTVATCQEELREEKLRAKEEAEDLAQEMAEFRYQITGLLEEECRRRACIEQASLQRIAELEAQVLMFKLAIFHVSI